jgi:uncharacterized membrane protein required for colicin V production
MTMPQTIFSLLGCIAAVYIAVRLLIKTLCHMTVWTISKLEE